MKAIQEMLNKEHSRRQTGRVVKAIGTNPERFKELLACYYSTDPVIAQRAAWALGHCVPQYPGLIKNHLKKLLLFIQKPGLHSAMKRNVVRMLEYIEIPENLEGLAADVCFQFIKDPKETIAVKAFSLGVLLRLSLKYPDLQPELIGELDRLSNGSSAGLKNRIGKVRARLEKQGR